MDAELKLTSGVKKVNLQPWFKSPEKQKTVPSRQISSIAPERGTRTLIRFFDHNDRLLYVSATESALTRAEKIIDDSPWRQQIKRITYEIGFKSKTALETERRETIKRASPKYVKR